MSAFISKAAAFARETLTVSSVVKTLTATSFNATSEIVGLASKQQFTLGRKAKYAVVVVDSVNAIRVTEDGTAPVAATTGTPLNQNDIFVLESYEAIVKFKMIREGAADSTVQVTYYR